VARVDPRFSTSSASRLGRCRRPRASETRAKVKKKKKNLNKKRKLGEIRTKLYPGWERVGKPPLCGCPRPGAGIGLAIGIKSDRISLLAV
jgi:hypothetical protein